LRRPFARKIVETQPNVQKPLFELQHESTSASLSCLRGYYSNMVQGTVKRAIPSVAGKEIIDQELHKLLHKEVIKQAPYCKDQFISNTFLVAKKTGDLRPVINLKPLNESVEKIYFKIENIDLVKNPIKPGDYLASIDLKDVYFSIPIWQSHRQYLSFLCE